MIVGADVVSYELPFRMPVLAGDGILESRAGVLLGLFDDAGNAGWGEAAPLPGWSRESLPEVAAALEALAGSIGSRPRRPTSLAATALAWLPRMPTACSALDQALLDLSARQAGVPLARLLSGRDAPAATVPVNALISGVSPDDVAAAARSARDDGFETFKLKIADGAPAHDVARVGALREAIGPGPAIRLDAGGRWDVETAVDTLARLETFGIEYVEDPVPDLDALAQVAASAGVPVAVDSLLGTGGDPFAVVAAAAASIYVLKPAPLGGPGPASRIAARIADIGGSVVVTSFFDAAVGLAGAVHLAASVAPGPACGLATSYFLAENVATPPMVSAGHIRVPGGPGLGVAPAARAA